MMGRIHDPVMTTRAAAPIVLFARRRTKLSVEMTKQRADCRPCTRGGEREGKATGIGISLLRISVFFFFSTPIDVVRTSMCIPTEL